MNNNTKVKYPCLFIFLIDQSFSMLNTIKKVINTLTRIIQSLPENSYYQLIGFGSSYKVYNKIPELNTEENLKKVYNIINSLDANLGGTNLSEPLNYILKDSYSDYKDINISKQIMVLTDGDINVGEDIIELIKLHNNEFLIHFIGIGNEVNKKLIIEAGKSGNGTYYFIDNSLNELNNKVFEIINNCTKEYINNYKFILNKNNKFELNPINKTTYNKESLKYCFIQKGKEKIENLNIKFNYENLKEKSIKDIEFKYDDIINLPEGEDLSKLIIGLTLRYNLINDKEEKIKLSKLYQVLCNYTTLFAEIEGEKIIKNKMTTFTKNYSIRRIENFKRVYRGIDSGLTKEEVNLYYSKPVRRLRNRSIPIDSGLKREEVKLYYSKSSARNQSIFRKRYFWICFILIVVFICYFIIKYLNKK